MKNMYYIYKLYYTVPTFYIYMFFLYPDIIFTVPASRKFSVQIFIILKHYITYQIHKLIGFQVFEWLSFGLICVFDS